jgi:peptidoglycan/LPS O-acetylase OafA/YrhL
MRPAASDSFNQNTRWDVLALWRFVLAMIVVLGHFAVYIKPDPSHIFGEGYLHPLGAVYGFLILSGYSIASSLSREQMLFYLRRFVRIWPLYLACVEFGFLTDKYFSTGIHWPQGQYWEPSTDKETLGSLLMLQTFCLGPIPVLLPVWSLAVEWWFYMIAPFFKRHFIILLIAAASSLCFYILAHHRIADIREVEAWTKGMPGKFSMAMGWLWIIGYIYYYFPRTQGGIALLVVPAFFAAMVGRSPGIAYFLTVLVLVYSPRFPLLNKRLCNFLGDLSYPIFLFHMPVMALMVAFGHQGWIAVTLAVIAVSLIALCLIDYPVRYLFKRQVKEPIVHQ